VLWYFLKNANKRNSVLPRGCHEVRVTDPAGERKVGGRGLEDWKMLTHSIRRLWTGACFRQTFENALTAGQRLAEHQPVLLQGRITSRRESGKKLVFFDLRLPVDTVFEEQAVGGTTEHWERCQRVQVVCNSSNFRDFDEFSSIVRNSINRGDIVQFSGIPGKTPAGELSLFASSSSLLSKCQHDIPVALNDPDLRHRQRYLDMIVNDEVRQRHIFRSLMIQNVRKFFIEKGFLEVETPILWNESSGAVARPFVTHSEAFNMDLKMRIAPELFLKQVVIGGIDRVFEIGKVFRNEGIDASHNIEFTMCEAYHAYADYESFMQFTEDLLDHIASTMLKKDIGISFKGPYTRMDVIDTLVEQLKSKALLKDLSEDFDPNSEDNLPKLLDIARTAEIRVEAPQTLPRVLDKLIGEFVEPLCEQPTFLINHPKCMSPLAKEHHSKPGRTERFELFIKGKEICNSYSELNDPEEQRRRFAQQSSIKANSGDLEIPPGDEDFCTALEYALPPTAGWGLGIDRLCMLLTQVHSIREVLLFPVSKKD
jgi:lysyl-tRNA synthetase class 2